MAHVILPSPEESPAPLLPSPKAEPNPPKRKRGRPRKQPPNLVLEIPSGSLPSTALDGGHPSASATDTPQGLGPRQDEAGAPDQRLAVASETGVDVGRELLAGHTDHTGHAGAPGVSSPKGVTQSDTNEGDKESGSGSGSRGREGDHAAGVLVAAAAAAVAAAAAEPWIGVAGDTANSEDTHSADPIPDGRRQLKGLSDAPDANDHPPKKSTKIPRYRRPNGSFGLAADAVAAVLPAAALPPTDPKSQLTNTKRQAAKGSAKGLRASLSSKRSSDELQAGAAAIGTDSPLPVPWTHLYLKVRVQLQSNDGVES